LAGWLDSGERKKSELQILALLQCELDCAITDLSELLGFTERVIVYNQVIGFFEVLWRRPRPVTPELMYCWTDTGAEGPVVDQDAVNDLILEKLGQNVNDPTLELCEQILTGLREEKAALLSQKQEAPPPAETETPAAPVPTTEK
jgi:hypothetical protein